MSMANITYARYEPVPEGTYRVRVESHAERRAANIPNAEPFLAWQLDILNTPALQGKKISFAMGYNIGPNAMGTKFLKALGFVPPTEPGNFQLNPDQYIGRECYVRVKIEEKKSGQKNNKVTDVWSLQEMQQLMASAGTVQPDSNYQPPVNPNYQPPVQQQNYQPPVQQQNYQPPVQQQNYQPPVQQQNYQPPVQNTGTGQFTPPVQGAGETHYEPITRPAGVPGDPNIPQNPAQQVRPIQDKDDMKFPTG